MDGRVTGMTDGAIRGWIAADASGDGYLEAVAEGEGPFGRARAEPGADGRLHFSIPIPEALRDGRMRFIDVRPLAGGAALPGGPLVFDGGLFDAPAPRDAAIAEAQVPAVQVEGRVDFIAPDVIEGWAWAPESPSRRVELELLADGRFLVAFTADKPSADLAARRIGEARYGFRVDLSRVLRRGPHRLTVRVAGTGEALPGGSFTAGPFAPDGELDCPGYLDDRDSRARLETLPFEHLAFDARRIAPDRLVPRLINRLRRERMDLEAGAGSTVSLLLLPGEDAGPALGAWALQSRPGGAVIEAAQGPPRLREAARASAYVIPARGSDLLHPSAAAVIAGLGEADAVIWSRFCADEGRAGSAGTVLRRPPFDPVTARHGALSDTAFALAGRVLAEAPDEVLAALAAGRLHPLWFWLGGRTLGWRHHPEALTSRVGPAPPLSRAEVEADGGLLERLLGEDGGGFTLERTAADLPFPHVLVPVRRAPLTSVLVPFRNRAALTLRCIHALALQRLSGELELVLVDNRSDPDQAAAVAEGARALLGGSRVRLLAYDAPFNHSAQNNLAARAASGEAVVFCNNDVVLREPALLEQLAAWALQPGVGAVGCRLEDPERGRGSYGHVFAPPSADPYRPPLRENPDPAYGRHVHAAPGATLALAAMSRERFLALGGLDEQRFPIGYNDIELMLRAAASGLTHLYLGHLDAEHARGSSRTGDNEDLQALLINQTWPQAAQGHLRQLADERIETDRPDLAGPKAAALAPDAEAAAATPEAAIAARRALEARRLELAEALSGASELVQRLGEELQATRALAES